MTKTSSRILRSQDGFSLIQAIMIMAIIAVLGLAYAQMNQNEMRARRESQIREEYQKVMTGVQSVSGQPSALRATSELVD